MKFTRSRDGKMRATVRVEWRADIDMIAVALMHGELGNGPVIADATRRSVRSDLGSLLETHGNSWWAANEDMRTPEMEDRAMERARELFPELAQ